METHLPFIYFNRPFDITKKQNDKIYQDYGIIMGRNEQKKRENQSK